jgi:hypothetical protein
MSYRESAVWIDHQRAHIFRVGAAAFDQSTVYAPQHVPRHPQREAAPHNHPDDEGRFFSEVLQSLSGAETVLILGPSTAKLHFRDYLLAHPTSKLRIAGVETVDHPTDNQVAAYVRQYFHGSSGRHAGQGGGTS